MAVKWTMPPAVFGVMDRVVTNAGLTVVQWVKACQLHDPSIYKTRISEMRRMVDDYEFYLTGDRNFKLKRCIALMRGVQECMEGGPILGKLTTELKKIDDMHVKVLVMALALPEDRLAQAADELFGILVESEVVDVRSEYE